MSGQFRGKRLFAGRLFAGRLYGPAPVDSLTGGRPFIARQRPRLPDEPRKRRDDEELFFLMR